MHLVRIRDSSNDVHGPIGSVGPVGVAMGGATPV